MKMIFRFIWFVLFIYVCRAENDYLEGSGEGSGEGDLFTPENLWQSSAAIEQNNGSSDVLETTYSDSVNEGCGVDLLFILDTSGSLEEIYAQHINWTTQLTEALLTDTDQVHIAMIQYAETPITEFSFDTYRNPHDITNHIMTINFHSGGTRIGKALLAAKAELFDEDRGARKNAKKVIVLFTYGLSTDDPIKHAEQLRENEKVNIYVVYVGSDGFEQEMNRIAGGKSNIFGPHEFTRLKKVLTDEVENAKTCEWEISTNNPTIITTVTKIEPSDSSDQIATSTNVQQYTTGTSTTTSHKTLTKDTQLEHESKKISAQQTTLSEDQDRKVTETDVQNEIKDENINATPSVEEQFVRNMTIPQQSIISEIVNKNEENKSGVIIPKFAKLRKGNERKKFSKLSTNPSFAKGQESSRSADHSGDKTLAAPRHVVERPISIEGKSRKLESNKIIGKNREQCPREILFIVDSSGSVQRIYDQQKEYLLSLLNELQIGEGDQRVALIQFAGSSHQRIEWTFDTYKNIKDIAEALIQVRHFTGTTYIGRALENSMGVLETRRQGIPTTVILVSDGFSQDDASKPAEEIRRMPNVDFIAVSMSHLNNYEYLKKLTGDPSKVYVGPRSEDLKDNLLSLINCRRDSKL